MAQVILENHSRRDIVVSVVDAKTKSMSQTIVPAGTQVAADTMEPGRGQPVEDSFVEAARKNRVIAALFESGDLRVAKNSGSTGARKTAEG